MVNEIDVEIRIPPNDFQIRKIFKAAYSGQCQTKFFLYNGIAQKRIKTDKTTLDVGFSEQDIKEYLFKYYPLMSAQ